ncbi:hypothetical protein GWK47_026293 [Chionoecetes opilio]|uniref:Uncharacterized protein n=1 Tax=Chionoecetes opilio TaxID=41210 RepID=A0A8J8WMW9_CHIOP|nr:hypothetical protein GWK47_026293 [Chionoecetes opilio]
MFVGEEKKGATSGRDGRGDILLLPHAPGPGPGGAAARHAQRVLAGRPPSTSVEGGRILAHPPPREPPKLRLLPHLAARLKKPRNGAFRDCSGAWEPSNPPRVFWVHPRGVGTADSPLPAGSGPKTAPQFTVFPDLEKAVLSGPSSRPFFAILAGRGSRGKLPRPAGTKPPAPSGRGKFPGAPNHATRKWRTGPPGRHPQPVPFQPAEGGAGSPCPFPGWHRPAPAFADDPGPRWHRAGGQALQDPSALPKPHHRQRGGVGLKTRGREIPGALGYQKGPQTPLSAARPRETGPAGRPYLYPGVWARQAAAFRRSLKYLRERTQGPART